MRTVGVRTIGTVKAQLGHSYISEGKPMRMRRLCLKTSEAAGRGGLSTTSLEVRGQGADRPQALRILCSLRCPYAF